MVMSDSTSWARSSRSRTHWSGVKRCSTPGLAKSLATGIAASMNDRR